MIISKHGLDFLVFDLNLKGSHCSYDWVMYSLTHLTIWQSASAFSNRPIQLHEVRVNLKIRLMNDIFGNLSSFLSGPVVLQLLSVLALALAIWQLYKAHSQTAALREIQASLSTRYLGQFPTYLPDTVEIIHESKEHIEIVCDTPAYARFSDPSGWLDYSYAIQQAQQRGVSVRLTCLGDNQLRHVVHKQQSPIQKNWKSWKKNNIDKLRDLVKKHEKSVEIEDVGHDRFKKILVETNKKTLKKVFAHSEVVRVETEMPVCFWIVDSNKAIFTIATYTNEVVEHGFQTVDLKLINALKDMRRRYAHQSADAQF